MHDPALQRPAAGLRPLERTIVRLRDAGMDTAEIARRLGRRPQTIDRVADMAALRATITSPAPPQGDVLRPLERRVLGWRAEGEGHAAIAARFQRSPDVVARVEALALHKLGQR